MAAFSEKQPGIRAWALECQKYNEILKNDFFLFLFSNYLSHYNLDKF